MCSRLSDWYGLCSAPPSCSTPTCCASRRSSAPRREAAWRRVGAIQSGPGSGLDTCVGRGGDAKNGRDVLCPDQTGNVQPHYESGEEAMAPVTGSFYRPSAEAGTLTLAGPRHRASANSLSTPLGRGDADSISRSLLVVSITTTSGTLHSVALSLMRRSMSGRPAVVIGAFAMASSIL